MTNWSCCHKQIISSFISGAFIRPRPTNMITIFNYARFSSNFHCNLISFSLWFFFLSRHIFLCVLRRRPFEWNITNFSMSRRKKEMRRDCDGKKKKSLVKRQLDLSAIKCRVLQVSCAGPFGSFVSFAVWWNACRRRLHLRGDPSQHRTINLQMSFCPTF